MATPKSKPAAKAPYDRTQINLGLLLHFFANLSLVTDVDEPLAEVDLGRPHHRILYFATHAPGITVNELLDAMHVTHQNLRIPMKSLVERGLLTMLPATSDRRQRELHVTPAGRKLVRKLTEVQWTRIERAFVKAGPVAVNGFLKVYTALIDPRDAAWVARLQND